MQNEFRYVDLVYPDDVTLHLFKTLNGTPRADVKGPRAPVVDGARAPVEAAACKPLPDAFAIAIRMANKNDVSIVVTGDATLWQPRWGELTYPLG